MHGLQIARLTADAKAVTAALHISASAVQEWKVAEKEKENWSWQMQIAYSISQQKEVKKTHNFFLTDTFEMELNMS